MYSFKLVSPFLSANGNSNTSKIQTGVLQIQCDIKEKCFLHSTES